MIDHLETDVELVTARAQEFTASELIECTDLYRFNRAVCMDYSQYWASRGGMFSAMTFGLRATRLDRCAVVLQEELRRRFLILVTDIEAPENGGES